jgi:hypothetical protein
MTVSQYLTVHEPYLLGAHMPEFWGAMFCEGFSSGLATVCTVGSGEACDLCDRPPLVFTSVVILGPKIPMLVGTCVFLEWLRKRLRKGLARVRVALTLRL